MNKPESFIIPAILSFGPVSTKAGAVFNLQPNGESTIWLKVMNTNRSCIVKCDNEKLVSTVTENLITSTIPKKFYTEPGEHKIFIQDEATGMTSNFVIFTVQ